MNTNLMIEILDQDVLFFTDTLNPADVYVEYKLANGAICFDSVYNLGIFETANTRSKKPNA